MAGIDTLRANLAALQKAPIYAKADAAEKALACAVQVLDSQAANLEAIVRWLAIERECLDALQKRITTLEKGAGDGGKN